MRNALGLVLANLSLTLSLSAHRSMYQCRHTRSPNIITQQQQHPRIPTHTAVARYRQGETGIVCIVQ